MKHYLPYLLILLFIGISGSKTFSQDQRVPGQLMIQVNTKSYSSADALDLLEQDFTDYNLQPKKNLSKRVKIWLLTFNASKDGEKLLEEIRNHPAVSLAQFNHRLERREASSDTIPNDPDFEELWGLHNTGQTGGVEDADVDAPEAWGLTQGGLTVLGDTIVAAVVDGGMDLDHEDLDTNLWTNYHEIPGNDIDDDSNGYVDDVHGWNAYSSNGDIPGDSHGTHVGGTVSARGNNDIGVAGVNWNAQIMAVAASSTFESTVVEGYSYVLDMRALYNETDGDSGAFVVSTNASFGVNYGDPDDFPIWGAMYDSLGYEGVLSTGATMNIGVNVDEVGDVPTAMESDYLISVTNTTDEDLKNSGAAYGLTTIDLGAPGTSIYSTEPGDNYGYKTGTSMATPHVTGAIALLFSYADTAMMEAYKENPDSIAHMIKEYLLFNVDPLPSLEGITVSGGRLNLYNSLLAMDTVPIGPQMALSEDTVDMLMSIPVTDTTAIEVTNAGGGAMNYEVAVPDSSDWISTDFELGTLYGEETDTVNFIIAGDSLGTGQHEGKISFIHDADTTEVVISVQIGLTTDVDQANKGKEISLEVAPNPFNRNTRFTLKTNTQSEAKITLHNMTGNLIKVIHKGLISGEVSWNWDGSNIGGKDASPGIYLLRAIIDDRVYTKKLIKQR